MNPRRQRAALLAALPWRAQVIVNWAFRGLDDDIVERKPLNAGLWCEQCSHWPAPHGKAIYSGIAAEFALHLWVGEAAISANCGHTVRGR